MADLKIMMKDREAAALAIEKEIVSLSKKIKEFAKQDLEIYKRLHEPDALFNDCPISTFYTNRWLKQFMIKCDMDFVGYNLDGKHTIKTFHQMAVEASRWVLKFTKAPAPKKTGVEAIL